MSDLEGVCHGIERVHNIQAWCEVHKRQVFPIPTKHYEHKNLEIVYLLRSQTISLLPRQQEAKIVSFLGFHPTWKTSSLHITKIPVKKKSWIICTTRKLLIRDRECTEMKIYYQRVTHPYLWQSKVCNAVLIFLRSNNLTVLSVEPVATTHSLNGLKAKQFTWDIKNNI